jgi:hypothetical protein
MHCLEHFYLQTDILTPQATKYKAALSMVLGSSSPSIMQLTCKVAFITQTTSKLHNIVDLVIIGLHSCQEGLVSLYQVFCLFQVDLEIKCT